jgi:UDP-N-acetyl-D-mannosaminuronate dehydrogenase
MPDHQTALLARITDRSAVVALVGLGYIGFPSTIAFAEHGFEIVGSGFAQLRRESYGAGRFIEAQEYGCRSRYQLRQRRY